MLDKQTLHIQAFDRPPGGIAIELTTHCNLACKMCSAWKRCEEELAHDKILSLMGEARSLGATKFSACGTEPFTREDTPAILACAEGFGFQEICAVSNGVLLNEGQRLEKLERLRNLNIVISLDGPREVHDDLRGKGVYDKAVNALQLNDGVLTAENTKCADLASCQALLEENFTQRNPLRD